jgi:glycosyltransferase involved in cell wall biosynthesis
MTRRIEISRHERAVRSLISNQLGRACGLDRKRRSEIRDQNAEVGNQKSNSVQSSPAAAGPARPTVALLTAGRDKPYALGLASALLSADVSFDFIGSDMVDGPELHGNPLIRFMNFRDQQPYATAAAKVVRVLAYYWRLIRYTATAEPRVFHILWNNKFEFFDRTLLMLYYKLMGKRIVLTVHNVNIRKRDSNDSRLNRLSLRTQYALADHIFVHSTKMLDELLSEFRVPQTKTSVMPFGINNTVPSTSLSTTEAKRKLGLNRSNRTLLFFGNIAQYKGLEHLVTGFTELATADETYRLIIVGRPKGRKAYWNQIQKAIASSDVSDRVIQRIEYIPDEETELYFKAADVVVLPYTHIFQSGVLFLGYSFGLPAIVADVGSLKDEVIAGETGFVFRACDPSDLAQRIRQYFASELFRNLETRRADIREYANERYSWTKVAAITTGVYSNLLSSR